mgnify:CR=1 FL=1
MLNPLELQQANIMNWEMVGSDAINSKISPTQAEQCAMSDSAEKDFRWQTLAAGAIPPDCGICTHFGGTEEYLIDSLHTTAASPAYCRSIGETKSTA